MKRVFCFYLVTFLLLSCSNNQRRLSLFNPGNLRTQHFTIDPAQDTTILGFRGGIFSIEKGSFQGEGLIDIEIKEVYSPSEIAYAGLATESNGRLLESGGMIFMNAKRNGNQLKLLKPVAVSIPANYINKEMKLFRGEEKKDGSVNWTDPEPLDTVINKSPVDSGRVLFETYCTACHNLFYDQTGPALAFVEDRVNDRNILKAFIKNPSAVVAENAYFQCEQNRNGSIQPAFPNLTDREIDLILDYIKNEGDGRPDLKPHYGNSKELSKELGRMSDSSSIGSCLSAPCGFDTLYVDTTNYQYVSGNMMDLHEEATKEDSMDYLYKKPDSLEKVMREKGFIDVLPTEGRYNFRIATLGWFNVDAFYEGMKGTEIVDLFVNSSFEEEKKLEVHVFFPAKKILTVGTFHNEDGLFHFEKYKGQIPLFLNDEAIAFGFTSIKEKIYYGITSFKVGRKQTIELNIKEGNKEELEEAFRTMNLDGINLDIITKKRIVTPRDCNNRKDSTAKMK